MGMVLAQCTTADDLGIRKLQKPIRELESTIRSRRQQAIASLCQANTTKVLNVFKKTFPMLRHEGRYEFRTRVLPQLSPKDVDVFLLRELRAGFAVQQKIDELKQRVRGEGEHYEIEAAYEQLYDERQWWKWIVLAKKDLSYIPTYEELYSMLMRFNERGFPISIFSKALHQRDSERAEADFQRLLYSDDERMKRRGIWALEAARVVPPTDIALRFFETADIALLDESDQFVHTLQREHLALLLQLVSSPSKRVRSMAEYRLCRIGHITKREAEQLVAGAVTSQHRAKAWQHWWAEHKDDSEEALRDRCLAALISEAETKLTIDVLRELAGYGDHSEVYPVFVQAISSPDIGLRKTAIMQLGNMAARGYAMAVDVLIEHCQKLTPEDFSDFAEYLARIKDDRIEPLFLRALEAQPGQDTMWKRRIARAIGQAGHRWALQPLVRLIIEEGSGNAAVVLTHVEGSEQAVPQLLEAMVKETDRNKRRAIRSAIEGVGAEELAEKLTTALPQAPQGSIFKGGPRYDVLKLMELFPDPNAKPFLQNLLESENPWDRLGAARVLSKLGVYSGAACLIESIESTNKISASYFKSHVGEALRVIGSPDTRERLVAQFSKADLEVKRLILHIMAQQGDPVYLSFLEKQLGAKEPDIAAAARYEIGYLIYLCSEDKPERLKIFEEDDLPPIRDMLLWAFLDHKICKGDPSYPNGASLKNLKGALVRANRYQHLEFTVADKGLRLLLVKPDSPLIASDGTKAGRQQPYADGRITRSLLEHYMTIFLHLNNGGASYLFKRDGNNWQPVGCLGWVN
jgi:HEAT repeat protein